MGLKLNMFLNAINFLIYYFVSEFNLVFARVSNCAKFHVLSQLIIILVLFYAYLRLVYFNLYILLSPRQLATL
jgi:hypothetical protein